MHILQPCSRFSHYGNNHVYHTSSMKHFIIRALSQGISCLQQLDCFLRSVDNVHNERTENGGVAMCMNCSVFCDRCKPPEMRGFVCPKCGKTTVLSREACLRIIGYRKSSSTLQGERKAICKKCGEDLSELVSSSITPQPCLYSNIVCGYPCGRRFHSNTNAKDICKTQVFAGRLPLTPEAQLII